MQNLVINFQNKLYIRFFSFHAILLTIALTGRNSREIILELESNFFKVAGPSKLIFIIVSFLIFSILAFFLPTLFRSFDNLGELKRKYFVVIPTLSFLTYIIIPTYHKYFSGQPVFTDLAYTVQFLADKAVQSVSDSGLVYPSSFLWIRNFSIPSDQVSFVFVLSILASFTFIICIIHFSMQLSNSSVLILTALLVSPPIKWLFESQNLDLFIIITLYFCSIIYRDSPGIRNTFGILLLTVIALVKLYTVPVLFYLFLISKSKVSRIQCAVSIGFLITVLYKDSEKILILLPIAADNNAIGMRVVLYFLGFDQNLLSLLSIAAGVISLVAAFVFAIVKKGGTICKIPVRSNIYIFSVIIFVLSMITTSNYPYRMIFLVFIVPLLFNQPTSSLDIVVASYAFLAFFCYTRSLGIIQNIFLLPILMASIYSVILLLLKDYQNQNKFK